jgi:hypothetical protein
MNNHLAWKRKAKRFAVEATMGDMWCQGSWNFLSWNFRKQPGLEQFDERLVIPTFRANASGVTMQGGILLHSASAVPSSAQTCDRFRGRVRHRRFLSSSLFRPVRFVACHFCLNCR